MRSRNIYIIDKKQHERLHYAHIFQPMNNIFEFEVPLPHRNCFDNAHFGCCTICCVLFFVRYFLCRRRHKKSSSTKYDRNRTLNTSICCYVHRPDGTDGPTNGMVKLRSTATPCQRILSPYVLSAIFTRFYFYFNRFRNIVSFTRTHQRCCCFISFCREKKEDFFITNNQTNVQYFFFFLCIIICDSHRHRNRRREWFG